MCFSLWWQMLLTCQSVMAAMWQPPAPTELNYSFILFYIQFLPITWQPSLKCFVLWYSRRRTTLWSLWSPVVPSGPRGTLKHPTHYTPPTPDRQINTPGPSTALWSHPLSCSAQYFSVWVLFQSSSLLAMECFSSRSVRAKLPLDWTCSGGGCLCAR